MVLETDEGQDNFKRASKESGLDIEQVRKLQRRANKARSSGYTLRHQQITLKPKNYEPEGPGLLGDIVNDQKHVGKPVKGTPAKTPTAADGEKRARESRLTECGDNGACSPCLARARARHRLSEAMRRRRKRLGRTLSY